MFVQCVPSILNVLSESLNLAQRSQVKRKGYLAAKDHLNSKDQEIITKDPLEQRKSATIRHQEHILIREKYRLIKSAFSLILPALERM